MRLQDVEDAPIQAQEYLRHPLEVPEATLAGTFYPCGFPIEVRTNDAEVLDIFDSISKNFAARFRTPPANIQVHVVEDDETECPPSPDHQIMLPLLVWSAGTQNFAVADLDRTSTQVVMTRSALRHRLYASYFFLEPAASTHICTRFATPIHGACVALDNRGVLLCGDSGAGKSSLSYACARAGWTYVSDDATMLLHGNSERMALGNCHQVRFRPSAAELFPEIAGLAITPRAEGKPSIEVPTALMPHLQVSEMAAIDCVVYLCRDGSEGAELVPASRNQARQSMRETVFGTRSLLAAHYATIDRLLTAEVYELHYSRLDAAIARLRSLLREGR